MYSQEGKIKAILKNPKWFLIFLNNRGIHLFSDETFIKLQYKLFFHKDLDLENPKTYNEKLQWLKLHDRKPEYCQMVDKYEAKKYIAKIIGKEYIIPTLGVYDSFDEIDFDKLPKQFVIKCTHDSGGLVICRDKDTLDIKKAKKKITDCLKKNYYYVGREWPYKDVRPRIIVEKYMEDKESESMRDYKLFCFDGKPEIMYLSEGLENHATASMSFYDMDFKLTDCKRSDYKLIDYTPKKPKNWAKMKKFSSILSNGIPHIRVDWYEINGKLYFGELTLFTCSGLVPFEDERWDRKLGDLINLSLAKDEKQEGSI